MAIDPHYIPAFSIEDVLLDKDTGAPLTGGLVYFEQDNQRGVLKPVYQITGTSPNYSYTQLPNPMTLSSIGTFEDSMGNPVIPYFFPYDSEFNAEYYYIRVTNSEGVEQFTREAQPYISLQGSNEMLSVITNELSNPQFASVVFDTTNGSYTYSVNTVVDNVINIAPDWDLIVSAPAAGTVTLTQLKPTGSLNILTNPGTLLTISSAGLTKLQLRQRVYGSPNLWGSGYLSASFVAKTYSGTGVTLTMYYSQSNGTIIDQVLVTANLPASGAYESFPGSALIPASTSTESYPTAYIDIYFDIPLSIQIDITSVMVAFTGATSIANLNYDQESNARQIDHLYHDAYPVVPVGTVIDYYGYGTPAHYFPCNGAEKNRISNSQLFAKLTNLEAITLTNGSPTITVSDGTIYIFNGPVEGTGIPAGTTIIGISGNTITLSANATVSGLQTLRFFCVLNGNGTTTFNLPSLAGYVIAGFGGSLFSGAGISNGIGQKGGAATHGITINEMPSHNHPGSTILVGSGGGGTLPTAANLSSTTTNAVTVAPQGGGTLNVSGSPMSLVQLTALAQKMIRFE